MRKQFLIFSIFQRYIFILGAMWLFFACTTRLDEFDDLQDNEGYIEFTFSTNSSRANIEVDGSGFFTDGDAIGLYINNGSKIEFRKLIYTGGKWIPSLRRSEFGDGELTFSAHYPLVSETESTLSYQIPANQNTEGYNPADILFAQSSLPAGEYKSKMIFNHKMHRLKINLSDGLKNAGIKVRTLVNGEINLLTGETSVSSEDTSFALVTPKKNDDGSLEAIIYPQSIFPYQGEEGLIEISLDGKNLKYKVPEKGNDGELLTAFEAGKTFTVNLTVGTPDVEWANKKVWVYGINAPEDDSWVSLFPTISTIDYLLYKDEYKWFDVNKRNPSNFPGGIQDGMLCWAAAGSNMIHWWIDRNKEYIDKYVALNKYKGPDYHYDIVNAVTEDKQESEIFQSFLDSYVNAAGYIDDGINWFIHGELSTSIPMRDPINYAGYFKDVFPENVKLAKNVAGMSKENFNKTIKNALLNKMAIGFNAGYIRNTHAMTIWGAEFDGNGDISYIYMVDNNDRDLMQFYDTGCLKRKIVYITLPEGGVMTGYKKGSVDEPEDSYNPITRLYTLELGTDYWKEYFSKPENNR